MTPARWTRDAIEQLEAQKAAALARVKKIDAAIACIRELHLVHALTPEDLQGSTRSARPCGCGPIGRHRKSCKRGRGAAA